VAQHLKSKQDIYRRNKIHTASTAYKRKKSEKRAFLYKLYEKHQEEKNYSKGKLMCAMAKKLKAKYEHSYHKQPPF
jgi:hypothetical protein